jgi:hypothetical protein
LSRTSTASADIQSMSRLGPGHCANWRNVGADPLPHRGEVGCDHRPLTLAQVSPLEVSHFIHVSLLFFLCRRNEYSQSVPNEGLGTLEPGRREGSDSVHDFLLWARRIAPPLHRSGGVSLAKAWGSGSSPGRTTTERQAHRRLPYSVRRGPYVETSGPDHRNLYEQHLSG